MTYINQFHRERRTMLEESCPIEVFAAELRRRIQESSGDAQKDLQTLSYSDAKIEHFSYRLHLTTNH